jgi:hypothetical protein
MDGCGADQRALRGRDRNGPCSAERESCRRTTPVGDLPDRRVLLDRRCSPYQPRQGLLDRDLGAQARRGGVLLAAGLSVPDRQGDSPIVPRLLAYQHPVWDRVHGRRNPLYFRHPVQLSLSGTTRPVEPEPTPKRWAGPPPRVRRNYRCWHAAMTARCPVRGTAWTLTVGLALAGALSFRGGVADASTRDSLHCPRPSQLRAGSRSEAIRAARKGLPSTFELREATRVSALPGHQDRYFLACGATASSLTWFVDLHPPGMGCAACDSHLYLARFRQHGWRDISWFAF